MMTEQQNVTQESLQSHEELEARFFEIKEAMHEAMKKLPQYKHFDKGFIDRFIRTYWNDKKPFWHIDRLRGIGGSEIGVLVAEHLGMRDSLGRTSDRLMKEKLLIVPPVKMTIAMRKGILGETLLREFFLEDYKAERDMECVDRMNNEPLTLAGHEWMRYSPDDVVRLGGKRYLIDYKNPAEASLHDDLNFGYICQLHQGRMIMENNDMPIDGMLLVQMPGAGQGDSLVVTEVLHDPEVDTAIIEAGDKTWATILTGSIPDPDASSAGEKSLPEDILAQINDLSNSLAKSKAMMDAAEARKDEIQKRILSLLGSYDVREASTFAAIKVSASDVLDTKVALEALGDHASRAMTSEYSLPIMIDWLKSNHPEVDLAQFENGKMTANPEKLNAVMAELELDPAQFTRSQYRVTQRATNEYRDVVAAIAASAMDELPEPEVKGVKAKSGSKAKSAPK